MDTEIHTYDNNKIRPIEKIEFGILSNNEVKNMSALGKDTQGIEYPDLYEVLEPKRGGLIDPRMGTTDSTVNCHTCGYNNTYCNGHFGHIELAEAVFHIGFIDIIKKVLGCICINCSKLLIRKSDIEIEKILKTKSSRNRLGEIRKLVKNTSYCTKTQDNGGCGSIVPKLILDTNKKTAAISLYAEYPTNNEEEIKDKNGEKKKKEPRLLKPEIVYDILKNISDRDCEIMGLNPKTSRPENMIIKTFPVPPVQIRPSAKAESMTSTIEDDLTHKLADIMKANLRLRKHKENITETTAKYSIDHIHFLQYHCATYFDNESLTLPKSEQKNKSIKSLTSRVSGKEGHFRGNLMGKRTDFSARTVIGSDPTIGINELRVPLNIAKTITFPEVVTKDNIESLQKLVRNGPNTYPGANFVFPMSSLVPGKKVAPIYLKYLNESIELKYGDIVERHLLDNDVILFNRQPTLHKVSMMAHRAKIINNNSINSFGMSVYVCKPYNADFDGDEMNGFFPQSIQTQIELEEIAGLEKQIINPSTSKTIMGVEQDGLVGTFNITDNSVIIDWKTAMNIISYTSINELNDFKKEDYTGVDLFSMIIPKKINLNKGQVKIENGNLISGKLTKDVLGAGKQNSIQQIIWDQYGPNETVNFLNNNQKLINSYNMHSAFSIGIDDIMVNEKIEKEIDTIINTKDLKVAHMVTELENNPELMDNELFDKILFEEINVVRDEVAKLVQQNQDPKNQVLIMAQCGSKGDHINTGQMSGCVGLQSVSSQFIPKNVNNRTLPYYHQNQDTPEARGLIKQSFTKGLDYPQFFFLNQGARVGLIDQAVKTAESGYIQRKLVKTMEDLVIKYDCTLRNVNNSIIQFIYGDNGADPRYQYEYNIKMIEQNNKEIEQEHKFTNDELKELKYSQEENELLLKYILDMRDKTRKYLTKSKLEFIILNKSIFLPLNITRLINTVKKLKHDNQEKLTIKYITDKYDELLLNKNTMLACLNNNVDYNKSFKVKDELINKTALLCALYDCMSPRKVLFEHKMSKNQFDTFINDFINIYNKNIVQPGEHSGVLSAQAIGEPVSQMTLKAFHKAGIGKASDTLVGVPRAKELFNLSKNIKTPQMIITLNDEYYKNKDMAQKIASYIRYTTLGQIINKIEIYYDPYPTNKGSFMEKDNVNNVYYTHNTIKTSCASDINNLPWLIRIELNREKMLDKEVTLLEIKSKFCNQWEKRFNDNKKKEEKPILDRILQCALLSNTDNDDIPIMHLRIDIMDFDFNILNNFIDLMINKFKLKGIKNINELTSAIEERVIKFDSKDGSVIKDNQYVIYTQGVNLYDIRYLIGIDIYNTICNDVVHIYNVFGVEAARAVLMKEISLAFHKHGADVNFNHLSVIVDLMTYSGYLMSVDRHGMNKSENEPLARVSFEKMVDQLLTAATFNEVDNMKGVSSRIMAGLCVKGGTGMCDVILDTELIENSEFVETSISKDGNTINQSGFKEVVENNLIKDMINNNNVESSDIFMPL